MSKKKVRKPDAAAPDAVLGTKPSFEPLIAEVAAKRRAINAARRGLEAANIAFGDAIEAAQLAESDLWKAIEARVQAVVGPEAGHLQPGVPS